MPRKRIPNDNQRIVLLKSRRRCCLCFWLQGHDEVKKGQIAHLDQDNENLAENNLVFLCFNHHDEYDGKTGTSKGLRQDEVRQWRDELYKEMEYRFRTLKRRGFELKLLRFLGVGLEDDFKAEFRLRNAGEVAVRSPIVSIRLPEGVRGRVPGGHAHLGMREMPDDLFESGGRVGVIRLLGMINPVLMPDHSTTFDGLGLRLRDFPLGTKVRLEYRVDAEDMAPAKGSVEAEVPHTREELFAQQGRP